jgi:hypothetical protein
MASPGSSPRTRTDSPRRSNLIGCPEIESGSYRFVYWGTIGEPALGVEFEVE